MKTKNHIKTPNTDTLRGIGKLGWTESGRVHGTLKKLSSTFDTESKSKGKKEDIVCPVCKNRMKTNNTSRVPNHRKRVSFYYRYGNINDRICEGSWSKQEDKSKETIYYVDSTGSQQNKITVGDVFIADFTRACLQELGTGLEGLQEITLEKIECCDRYSNDGTRLGGRIDMLHFKEFTQKVPDFRPYTTYIISKNKFN